MKHVFLPLIGALWFWPGFSVAGSAQGPEGSDSQFLAGLGKARRKK
jgi:hypothetical protein